MRLAISTNSLGRGGGMERYAGDLISGFRAGGADVTVICRKVRSPAPPGCTVRRVPTGFVPSKLRDRYFSFRVGQIKKGLGGSIHIACSLDAHPDVAICGGTHIGFLAALGRPAGFFDRLKISLERRQYSAAGVTVAHSRRMREELTALYGVGSDRLAVLYPPVDKERFRPLSTDERAAARRRFGFAEGRSALLFPSGSHERKGLPFITEFLARTELPVDLFVAGREAEEDGRVRYLGYVDDMPAAYAAADATVLASAYEPFGLVGVESALCGTPAVLAGNIGCCEVLRAPACRTFSLSDGASLEAAVAAVVRGGRGRLEAPEESVTYDCGVAAHVAELTRLIEERLGGCQQEKFGGSRREPPAKPFDV